MSSKRAIRRRQCKGKQRFATADDALRAMRALIRMRGHQGHMSPYRCRWCHGYHYGHTPGQRRF